MHGYTTAFWIAAAIFAAGAIATPLMLGGGAPEVSPDAEPLLVH